MIFERTRIKSTLLRIKLHFVMKLLCCFLQYKICQKSLRNWVPTLCNEIIISIYLPTFLTTSIISLLPQDLWPPYLTGSWFKVKEHLQLSYVILWWRVKWSHDKWKSYISTSMRSTATKRDRDVALDENMLSSKSHNLLIMWTHQVTWKIKNVISPFLQDLQPLNKTGW